jgi:plastocyanin
MRHIRLSVLSLVVVAAASLGLAACSSSSKAAAPVSNGGPSLTIKNFSFAPNPLTVKVGDTVTIANDDATAHTTTDGGGAFDTGPIAPGTKKTITITKAGTYQYHCSIHPSMTGTIQAA